MACNLHHIVDIPAVGDIVGNHDITRNTLGLPGNLTGTVCAARRVGDGGVFDAADGEIRR